MKIRAWMPVVLLMLIVFTPDALPNRENPGSCLLFPYYDTSGSTMSIHTITNVGTSTVAIRIVFVNGQTCEPTSTKHTLTAGDTLTFGAHGFITQPETGFIYVYVLESFFDVLEKKADVLIGQEIVLGTWDNRLVTFGINAVAFQAKNLTKDAKLRLDGTEYTCAPKTLYFPRFFGQDAALYSRVILINLTGGRWFKVGVNCLIYNDNEDVFSDYVQYGCFALMKLKDLSHATDKNFLLSTNHDHYEPWPFNTLAETGTIRLTGDMAESNLTGKIISDPSIYAVLVEGVATLGYTGADLPLQIEDQAVFNHAMLWSTDPNGN